MEWISVEDEEPPHGIEFQGWVKNFDSDIWFWEPRCIYDEDKGYGMWSRLDYDHDGWDFGLIHLKITHWMPLPEPPK